MWLKPKVSISPGLETVLGCDGQTDKQNYHTYYVL